MRLMNRFSDRTLNTIHFTYFPLYREGGGTTMRSEQLSQIVKPKMKELGFKVNYTKIDDKYENSIIYMPKMVILTSSDKLLSKLKEKNNILIFDPIDGKSPDELMKYADVVVAASWEGYIFYKEKYHNKMIFRIDHHVDPRIRPQCTHEAFKVGYFGNLSNTIITDNIQKAVDVFPVDTSSQKDLSWMKKMPSYSLHYAVRRYKDNDGLKPATKIFTAARCGANIIIQRSETEAVHWLGQDYPYICDDTSEKSILKTIEYARSTCGEEQWNKGLRTMKNIDKAISYESISRQFNDMVQELRRVNG